ncbi:MAG: cation diffusion facilitator family transporter [Acidimicrobiales bacterium]
MPNESTRTVLVSLGAGLGVALTKAVAAVITGSAAMAAEASHSLADSANDVLLFVAQVRSSHRPDDQHPLGYGREAYFWTLIAALGVFVAGAAFSLREGIEELIHPSTTTSFLVAYIVLVFSTVFDLVSIRQSAGQMAGRARRYNREFLEESQVTSDTTLRAVFLEDAASIFGDVITIAALGLNQITGSSIFQGVAAVLIGLVMVRIGLRLVQRSHDFLVGAWVLTPQAPQTDGDGDFTRAFRPADEERIRAFLLGYPGVTGIRELLLTFVGPSRVWVVARIDIDGGLHAVQVESLVRGVESGMKAQSEDIYRVDVVPIGGARATKT